MRLTISPEIRALAGKGTADPSSVTLDEIEKVFGFVLGLIPEANALAPPGAHAVYNGLAPRSVLAPFAMAGRRTAADTIAGGYRSPDNAMRPTLAEYLMSGGEPTFLDDDYQG